MYLIRIPVQDSNVHVGIIKFKITNGIITIKIWLQTVYNQYFCKYGSRDNIVTITADFPQGMESVS